MAYFVSKQSGNWSDAASWHKCSNDDGDQSYMEPNTWSSWDGFSKNSQTFTAPSASDSCVGACVRLHGGSDDTFEGTLTLKLQEYNGSAWVDVATKTISQNDFGKGLFDWSFVFIKFSSAFQYTTTNADYYRFEISATVAAGYASIAYNSSSNVCAVLAVDDRAGVPTATDDIAIASDVEAAADVVITVNGAQECGGQLDTSLDTSQQGTWQYAINIGYGGTLAFDTAQASSLAIHGFVGLFSQGTWQIGTEANPASFDYIQKVLWDGDVRNGIYLQRGTISWVGEARDVRREVASGVGTAADPLIIDDDANWQVGDEIVVPEVGDSSTNYNGTQYRYIKTRNSATSYVLSDTPGGAESALTNTITFADGNSHVVNLARPIVCEPMASTGSSGHQYELSYFGTFQNSGYEQDYSVVVKNVRFDKHYNWDSKLRGTNGSGKSDTPYAHVLENMVFYDAVGFTSFEVSTGNINLGNSWTFTGLTFVKSAGSTTNMSLRGTGITFKDFNLIDCDRGATAFSGLRLSVLDNWLMAALNKDNSSSTSAVPFYFSISGNQNTIIKNADIYSCRSELTNQQSPVPPEFFSCKFGIRGKSQDFIHFGSNLGGRLVLTNCLFNDSPSQIISAGNSDGEVAVVNKNQNTNEHIFYAGRAGSIETTGAGLPDTTVRTTGSLGIRLRSFSSIGFFPFPILILAEAGKAVSVFGYAKKSAGLVGVPTKVRLTLPFSTQPDAEVDLIDDEEWNLWSISADYSAGTITSLAKVEIIVPAGSGTNYLYLDDILNGTNVISALDMFYHGKPADIMTDQVGDPGSIWSVQNANFAGGTMGELLDTTKKAIEDAQALIFAK
jgi:hypothetical protein